MKIAVIGTGYVGLVSGTCFAELGHDVICIDTHKEKIKALKEGKIPIFEPGLEPLVSKNVNSGNLIFADHLSCLEEAPYYDAILIAVGTPTDEQTGAADLTHVFAAAKELANYVKEETVIVTKSTVPVGTGKKLQHIFASNTSHTNIHIASNPEFLREGAALFDFMQPDRVIIGVDDERSREVMQHLYQPLANQGVPLLFTTIETAELTKYASNAFLAMKIAFTNEMADMCEAVGADIEEVVTGMGMDHRIGGNYMQPGPGFGGSCFPKDTRALVHMAQEYDAIANIIPAVISSNEARKTQMITKVLNACDGDVAQKTIAVLGMTFKANTDDIRYSPGLDMTSGLLAKGATVYAYDPVAIESAKTVLGEHTRLHWKTFAMQAIEKADAMVIVTEWNEFTQMDLRAIHAVMKTPTIVDLRNLLDAKECRSLGFTYVGLGRRAPVGKSSDDSCR